MVAHKVPVTMRPDDAQTTTQPDLHDVPESQLEQEMGDVATTVQELEETIAQLTEKLSLSQQQAARAQADYQNLLRRTQEDRVKFVKMAGRELVTDLLEPLSHLNMAAAQLNDPGLTMVVKQLSTRLEQNGLREIQVLGKPFDVHTMEATEILDEGDVVVTKVVTPGYELNGEVIAHAKVVLGKKK